MHTDISFRNLIKSNQNQIVFVIFLLIWNQADVRFVPNQSENGKYNLISVGFNKISRKKIVCVGTAINQSKAVISDINMRHILSANRFTFPYRSNGM